MAAEVTIARPSTKVRVSVTEEDPDFDIADVHPTNRSATERAVINVNEEFATLPVESAFTDSPSPQDVVLALADSSDGDTTVLIDQENDFTWASLIWLYIVAISSGALRFAEYLGEKLADLFGITSPRYGYVMEEWDRIQRRKKQEEKEQAEEQLRYQQAMEEKNRSIEAGVAEEHEESAHINVAELSGDIGRLSPVNSATPLPLSPSGNNSLVVSPQQQNSSVENSPKLQPQVVTSPTLEDVEL